MGFRAWGFGFGEATKIREHQRSAVDLALRILGIEGAFNESGCKALQAPGPGLTARVQGFPVFGA